MKKERAFFEQLAGAALPGWDVKLQPNMTPGQMDLASYTARTGGKVPTSQVQKLAEKMISANLIARPGHGIYTVADPFVRKVWLERRRLLQR